MPDYSNKVTMGLTDTSSREEVLAAVEEHERQLQRTRDLIASGEAFVGMGCRRYDPDRPLTGDKLLLERQKTAGEEDQSVPGWDQGA